MLIVTYLIAGPFANDNVLLAATRRIQPSAQLPLLFSRPNRLSISFLFVLAVAFIIWYYLTKTTSGYRLRMVGDNKEAAHYAGINVKRYQLEALLVGGALAGMAGSMEVLGNLYRMFGGGSPGYGFDGIPISMLAGGNPFGMIVGSILFGGLRVGSVNMQARVGVPREIVTVIQGVLIMLIAVQYIVRFFIKKYAGKLAKKEAGP
jgi:simple sugar transport system permease protein